MASVRKRRWNHNGQEREAWVVNYTDQEGKRRLKTFDKKKDADAFRQKVEAEISQGVHTAESASVSLSEAVRLFLEDSERLRRLGDISGNTLRQRRSHLEVMFLARMSDMLVSDLTTRDIQDFVDRAREEGYANNTVQGCYSHIHLWLEFCVRRRWVRRNVLKDERCKVPSATRREAIPSRTELAALLEDLRDRQPGEDICAYTVRMVAITLGIFAGLRPGEVFGLQWADVDFDAGLIRVRHTVSEADGLKAPKSKAGVRTVPMADQVRWALMERARYLRADVKVRGPGFESYTDRTVSKRLIRLWKSGRGSPVDTAGLSGYVLTTREGRPFYSGSFRKAWSWHMRRLGFADPETGLPRFTQHALRHAAASLWIAQGLPALNIKMLMGHSSIQITYDLYGHLLPEDDRNMVAVAGISAAFTQLQKQPAPLALPAPA